MVTYLFEIKLTPETKPLIDHLRSLKYVKAKRKKPDQVLRAVQKPHKNNSTSRKVKWAIVNKHLKESKN